MHPLVQVIAINEINRFLAPRCPRGRPRAIKGPDLLNLLEIMCRTSQPWHMLPTNGVSYKTVHRTFIQLERAGIFDRIHKAVVRIYLTQRRPKYHATDTTYTKNVCGRDGLGRNPTDRGRKATKISSITDDLGATLTFTLFPGNRSDQIVLPDTLVGFDVPRGMELFADKGYDSRANRALVCAQGYRERIGRCPNCRSGAKLESRRIDGVADAAIPSDNRYEHCSTCNINWQHDGVSIVNLCWVANEMLKNGHKSRPMWLKRPQTRENSSAPSGAQL